MIKKKNISLLRKKNEFLPIILFYFKLKELSQKRHTPAIRLLIPTKLVKDTGSDFSTQHFLFDSNGALQAEKMHSIYVEIQNSPTENLLLSGITCIIRLAKIL